MPLGAEAAGGGEIEVLPLASANVASKRTKATAAVSSSAAVKNCQRKGSPRQPLQISDGNGDQFCEKKRLGMRQGELSRLAKLGGGA